MADFGAAIARLAEHREPLEITLPTLPHLFDEVSRRAAAWPVKARIVTGEAEKFAAFRGARAALAASGTVTLELALAGVPMVGAYKVSRWEEQLKYLIRVSSILLPNLILEERAIPELLQRDCTAAALAEALGPLLRDGPERRAQADALAKLDHLMRHSDGRPPSGHAAAAVLDTIAAKAGDKAQRLPIGGYSRGGEPV